MAAKEEKIFAYDNRIAAFVDIKKLSLHELTELLLQYKTYRSYEQLIINQIKAAINKEQYELKYKNLTKKRSGGRPPSLSPEDIAEAKSLLADKNVTVEGVAKIFGVDPSTLYRHIPGGRGALDG